MSLTLTLILIALCASLSLVFSVLTYSLRDFSRARLETALSRRNKNMWLDPTVEHAGELAFLTSSLRLLLNLAVLLLALDGVRPYGWALWVEYTVGASTAALITLFSSVVLPHALANQAGETIIALLVRPLHGLRIVFSPLARLMHATERLIAKATAHPDTDEAKDQAEEELQSELLAVVEEGEKTGVVDETEREMIQSVIEFSDTTVAEVMTARPDIVGLPVDSSLEKIRSVIEESGHSRIPVYEGSLDHVIGILYARDLLRYVGEKPKAFDIRSAIRQAFFVPESKLVRDLLQDFRLQKVHIAIVLDEYGGTAGLVTIEDLLEELVGDISDEHEGIEPAVFKRIDDSTAEVDARIHIDELNRLLGTRLPENQGYDTLGGFISTHLGRIPQAGTQFEYDGSLFVILEAEPQRVTRVRVEVQPAVSV
ncbi:MAG: gliding motility protein GldE [Phycisphaerae bacterium]|jgi:CBS domain containing-hemolysin-like protein|nr:MAG: gliding motility protein GldE [Phycisphaerae bacterium]